MRKRIVLMMILFLGIISGIKAQQKLTPEKLWELGRVSEACVSPDGSQVIFGVTWYDLKENKGTRDIYSIPVAGGAMKNLSNSPASEYNAVWRPDGKKIAYLGYQSGTTQIWEMNPDGSDHKQVSDVPDGINGFQYSPDMKHIMFIKDVKLDNTVQDVYPDLPKADARIIDDLMYRHWDNWHDYQYSHVFVAPYENGKLGAHKDIMEGERWDSPLAPYGGMEELAWTPDSKKIAYSAKKLIGKDWAVSTDSDIYLYDLESGATKNLTEGMPGYDKCPVFSPDGRFMAWQSMKSPAFESDKERIMVMDMLSGSKEDYSINFDQSSSNFVWSKDGSKLYFISGTQATYQVYSLEVKSRKINQITKGDHDYSSLMLAGNSLVGTRMSMSYPVEIYRIDEKKGDQAQISFVNKDIWEPLNLSKVEKRWVKTTDNKDMLVWVILPPNFDPNKKYPAILFCQGGPQSAVSQSFSYRWNFQMMGANDYIIVAPNRRGLPTFGQEWNDQISLDYGGQNMKDYLSAIDAIAKEPYVDESSLGAVGASYGGFSVYWLAGNHQKRFKAFIAHCGMFNFESWYGATEEMFFANHDLGGAYWDKPMPQSYDFSPHNFVGNWDTPMLVIHGGRDFRIPYTEGMQAFNAAQLQGIPSRFLFFPDETHFVLKPQNSVLWQREFFRWLDKWLK